MPQSRSLKRLGLPTQISLTLQDGAPILFLSRKPSSTLSGQRPPPSAEHTWNSLSTAHTDTLHLTWFTQPPVTCISLLNWVKSSSRAEVRCYTFCSPLKLSIVLGLFLWDRSPVWSCPTCQGLSAANTEHQIHHPHSLAPLSELLTSRKPGPSTPSSWAMWTPFLEPCDWLFLGMDRSASFLSCLLPILLPLPSSLWFNNILGGPPRAPPAPGPSHLGHSHFLQAWRNAR